MYRIRKMITIIDNIKKNDLIDTLNNNIISTIVNSYNTGDILNGKVLGGLIGANLPRSSVIIDKCYNTGYIYSEIENLGSLSGSGLIGTNSNSNITGNTMESYIINSYNTGNVKITTYGGGLVAVNNQNGNY